MRNEGYYFEIHDLINQFMSAMDNIVIRRYNKDRAAQDRIAVRLLYSPKSRTLSDLTNKAGVITLPAVSTSIAGISRNPNRQFNKIHGANFFDIDNPLLSQKMLQPIPIDITMSVTIWARFQQDIEQIISNFAPYFDPYIIISWRLPFLPNQEIRTEIEWNNNVTLTYPQPLQANTLERWEADTSFTIKGWLFKEHKDSYKNIFKIESLYSPDFSFSEESTDYFTISARPQIGSLGDVWMIPLSTLKDIEIYGKQFQFTQEVYLSANNIDVFSITPSSFNLFANVSSLSALYPEFVGFPVEFVINSDNYLTVPFPSAQNTGLVDIIIVNEAGYGKLTTDVYRVSSNPYPISHPDYSSYTEWQYPYINGISIVNPL